MILQVTPPAQVSGVGTFEVISFIASIASLILAILSIWLSVKFYSLSTDAANKTTEAAKDVAASVERLESLFEKIYTDTIKDKTKV